MLHEKQICFSCPNDCKKKNLWEKKRYRGVKRKTTQSKMPETRGKLEGKMVSVADFGSEVLWWIPKIRLAIFRGSVSQDETSFHTAA